MGSNWLEYEFLVNRAFRKKIFQTFAALKVFPLALFLKIMYLSKTLTEGRRFAITDIHGCANSFEALLEKIGLNRQDTLFLLGDYISKGRDSKAVLDLILKLQQEGYDLRLLRGNHEEMLLHVAGQAKKYLKWFVRVHKCRNLLNKEEELPKKYWRLLESLPYYIETEDFFLVHAGLNFESENPLLDKQAMIWTRKRMCDKQDFLKGKTLVHGHKPTPLRQIKESIEAAQKIICLDNGCVQGGKQSEKGKFGKLLCLNLDTRQLITQKNIG